MIKPILYLLIALGGSAIAAANSLDDNFKPQKASDQVEVADLGQQDQENIFSTFCLETRDLIHEYLESLDQQGFGTFIFKILFRSAERLGLESYTFKREQAELLATKIRDSNNNLADFEISPMVQLPKEEKFIYLALFGLLDRTKNTASREALNKLDSFREIFGPTNMNKRLKEACDTVNKLEFALREALNDYLMNMRASVDVSLPSVRCTTSRKVAHLNRICRFALQAPTIETDLIYIPVETHSS